MPGELPMSDRGNMAGRVQILCVWEGRHVS